MTQTGLKYNDDGDTFLSCTSYDMSIGKVLYPGSESKHLQDWDQILPPLISL